VRNFWRAGSDGRNVKVTARQEIGFINDLVLFFEGFAVVLAPEISQDQKHFFVILSSRK